MQKFEDAKEWYQNVASSLQRAGVKIRLYHCYPELTDEKVAFMQAVKDEIARKPLPGNISNLK